MSSIMVTFAEIEAAAAQVRATGAALGNQLSELHGGVARIAARWEGEAQTQYRVRQKNWDTNAENLRRALDAIARVLDTAAQVYRSTESANLRTWEQH